MCFNVSPQTIIKLKLFKDDVVAMRMRATNPKVYLLPNRMFVASGFSCEKNVELQFECENDTVCVWSYVQEVLKHTRTGKKVVKQVHSICTQALLL